MKRLGERELAGGKAEDENTGGVELTCSFGEGSPRGGLQGGRRMRVRGVRGSERREGRRGRVIEVGRGVDG